MFCLLKFMRASDIVAQRVVAGRDQYEMVKTLSEDIYVEKNKIEGNRDSTN